MTQMAVRMGLHAAHVVPGVGALTDVVDADTLAAQADQLRVFLGKKFRRHEDVRLLLSPLVVLTPVLVGDLTQAARRRPLALFFDTYEQTGMVLDGWLRSVLDGAHGELPEDLVVSVAGRGSLDPGAWSAYLPVMADVPLEPFTGTEAYQFLAERGITDDRVTQVIFNVSGGLPLLLATLAENHPADPELVGDPAGNAVERFLKWEADPARKALAVAGAMPRVVDEDVLAILLDTEDPEQRSRLFTWLRSLPFVTDRAGRCRYHDVVRAAMVRLERRQSPIRWRERHHALAAAYLSWRTSQFRQDCWDDPAWRALRLEEAYHLLCADQGLALPGALADVVRASAEQPAAVAQWAQAIDQAGQDADAQTVRACGQRLEAALRLDQHKAMVACLEAVLAESRLPEDALPLALRTRGRALHYLNRYAEALADLDKAISLAPEDAIALAYRGATYLWLKRKAEALADLDKAIELDPSYQWAITRRGETYRLMDRFEEALADLDKVIDLDPSYQWAIASRGETYRQMGRFEEALADFNKAIKLNPGYRWAIASRGQTYQQMGRFEEALADFNKVTDIDPSYQWAITHRGETYRLMGRFEEALADFNKAIELNPGYRWAIASRGQTYQQMGRFEEALVDLNEAVKIDPGSDWTHYLQFLVNFSLGNAEQAHRHLQTAVDQARESMIQRPTFSNKGHNLPVYLAAKGKFEEAKQEILDTLNRARLRPSLDETVDDLRDLASLPGLDSSRIRELIELIRSRSSGSA